MSQSIIIIGSGIVGVSCALWLKRAGCDVIVVDKNGIGTQTSYGNAGIMASCSCVPVQTPGLIYKIPKMLLQKQSPLFVRWQDLPSLVPFLFKFLLNGRQKKVEKIADALSLLLHDSPLQHLALAKDSGAQKFINQTNWLFGYQSQQEYEADSFAWQLRKTRGHKFAVLNENQCDSLLKDKFEKIIACYDTGYISDPQAYICALMEYGKQQGIKFLQEEVSDFIVEGGRARGVIINGKQHMAEHVVLAAGIWSGKLAKKVGYKIPMQAERGYHIEFVNPSIKLRSPIMIAGGKFVLTPMRGRLRAAGIVEFGGLSEQRNGAAFSLLRRQTFALFPELKYDRIDEWMGYRPSTIDSLPMIGELEKIKNLWFALGHQHIGLSGGPKTGKWISQLITNQKLNVDLSAFNPDRFN